MFYTEGLQKSQPPSQPFLGSSLPTSSNFSSLWEGTSLKMAAKEATESFKVRLKITTKKLPIFAALCLLRVCVSVCMSSIYLSQIALFSTSAYRMSTDFIHHMSIGVILFWFPFFLYHY